MESKATHRTAWSFYTGQRVRSAPGPWGVVVKRTRDAITIRYPDGREEICKPHDQKLQFQGSNRGPQ
jgi:hypothetical protein